MDASRPVAWAIGLVVVTFGIAVIAGETTFVAHLTRLAVEFPTIGSHLGTIVNEIKLFAWDLFPFAMLSILLLIKLR
ncbi:MAG TPA: hypothetical protein VKD91_21270 [Pyrinomonadaceae bacterium]|nr:hypothetical protein [Pyrinomonadaceae bacterium]